MARLTVDEYKLLDRMNKRLRTWKKNNLSSEVINQVQNDLLNFYTKHNIDVPSRDIILFKKSNKFTDEEKAEILQIARAMESSKSSKISYYKKHKTEDERFSRSFETVKNNPAYNVNTFSEYIQFIDDMNNATAILSELMEIDSNLVARTYGYAKEHNLTTEEVNDIMLKAVRNYRDGDTMELFLQSEIEKKEITNYINVNLRDTIEEYAAKNGIEQEQAESIIDETIRNRIEVGNVESYIYDRIRELFNK